MAFGVESCYGAFLAGVDYQGGVIRFIASAQYARFVEVRKDVVVMCCVAPICVGTLWYFAVVHTQRARSSLFLVVRTFHYVRLVPLAVHRIEGAVLDAGGSFSFFDHASPLYYGRGRAVNNADSMG